MNIDENYFHESQMRANTIEDILAVGENILWRDKPDKKAHIAAAIVKMLPIAIIWLIFDGGFIGGISYGMAKGSKTYGNTRI